MPERSMLLIAACLMFAATLPRADAQEADSAGLVQIQTTDGNAYIGKILAEDSDAVQLRTARLGDLRLRRQDIVRIVKVDPAKLATGSYWFDNPQATRYFWAPDGYGLKAGEGYYQNVWVLFNQVSVGVSDHFSIGLGLVPLFLFGGASTPVWLTPKVSFPIKPGSVNVGVGALIGGVIGESRSSFGIAYGVTTFGSRDRNLTVGAGYGYSGSQWAREPMVTVSAMIRTGPHGYFLTENYLISTGGDELVLLSVGGRRMFNRAGLDFGLFLPIKQGQNQIIAIPWIGFTIPFGNTPKS